MINSFDETSVSPELRKERLLELARTVEYDYHPFNGIKAVFNMSDWICHVDEFDSEHEFRSSLPQERLSDAAIHNCNTSACLAGFAILLFDPEGKKSIETGMPIDYETRACAVLGLERHTASKLFTSRASSYITGAQAAQVVRNLAENGVLDWDAVLDTDSVEEIEDDYDAGEYYPGSDDADELTKPLE